jgi:hypothetical protein
MRQVFNPYLPSWEYIPDGEPYVFDDRLYIFGSHDAFNGQNYCVNDYVCWSAPVSDLPDWKYEGVIYRRGQDALDPEGNRCMCAPDVSRGPDGRYYLYYTLDLGGKAGPMSVAVCNTPAGKYEYYGAIRYPDGRVLGSQEGELLNFDPGIFIDDDGRIFLYTGIAPPNVGGLRKKVNFLNRIADGGYVIELELDMLTIKKEPKRLFFGFEEARGTPFEGHAFFEASSLRKINGKYYFIYCSENSHELCYAISDKPDGDFHFCGTLVSIGDVFIDGRKSEDALNYLGNTHGSLGCINGNWYVFYHRQTNLNQFSRQGCAEKICIQSDGFIPQVEITSCGLNGGHLSGQGLYEARIACNLWSAEGIFAYGMMKPENTEHPYFCQDGTDREDNPGQYIANMRDGSTAGFKYFGMEGAKKITATIRGNAKGSFDVSTTPAGDPIAQLPVNSSDEWHEVSSPLKAVYGKQALYFTFHGQGALNFLNFTLI